MEDNLTSLNLIVGFLSPLLISYINRPYWDARLKVFVMVMVSVVVGFLSALFSDQLNTADVTSSILITMTSAIVAYHGIFKPSGISKFEAKTSPIAKIDSEDRAG
jgi:hypothetical protein